MPSLLFRRLSVIQWGSKEASEAESLVSELLCSMCRRINPSNIDAEHHLAFDRIQTSRLLQFRSRLPALMADLIGQLPYVLLHKVGILIRFR